MSVIDEIAAERRRQVEAEGWTPEHDDEHRRDELAWAAVCYAAPSLVFSQGRDPWPWAREWDKRPHRLPQGETLQTRMRALEKAGALIAAELDRLQRVSDRLDRTEARHDQ